MFLRTNMRKPSVVRSRLGHSSKDVLIRSVFAWSIPLTLFVAVKADAYCVTPKNQKEKLRLAKEIYSKADTIFLGRLVRKYNFSGKKSEILGVSKTLKGEVRRQWSLWLPGVTDELTTSESPTSGLRVGDDSLFALRKSQKGMVIYECDAKTIFDPEIRSLVLSFSP